MDFRESHSYDDLMINTSSVFEIRLFYVRIKPCAVDTAPDRLTLRHLRRESAFTPIEINGSRVPAIEGSASVAIRRDRLDKDLLEVTYVTTDSVRLTGAVEFEVLEDEGKMILCGSLERMESPWGTNDSKPGWSVECYIAAPVEDGNSSFFQPKLGSSSPSIEIYIAGCCGGTPVILTKTILVSPRRKQPRYMTLDAIPEGKELDKEETESGLGICKAEVQYSTQKGKNLMEFDILFVQNLAAEEDEGKYGNRYYTEDMYYGEDGQLSWFNAGVRVGVGIGLGMCLGIGIGVGLLMRSYQATTRNFKRRFF